jgi:tellurite resistance protein TerC
MLRRAWRMMVLAAGLIVLMVGIALLVLPGPAFVVIPIGLAILATEFAWARRWLEHIRSGTRAAVNKLIGTK